MSTERSVKGSKRMKPPLPPQPRTPSRSATEVSSSGRRGLAVLEVGARQSSSGFTPAFDVSINNLMGRAGREHKSSTAEDQCKKSLSARSDFRNNGDELKVPNLEYPKDDESLAWLTYFLQLEKYLRNKLASYKSSREFCNDFDYICNLCRHLLESSKKMLISEPQKYIQYFLDQRVWKTALYDVIFIGGTRTAGSSGRKSPVPETMPLKVIELGIAHFKELAETTQKVFSLDLKPLFKKSGFLNVPDSKQQEGLDLIYKIFVYIGDLNRYALGFTSSRANRQQASDYYELARLVDPQKGRAFYQMGTVATLMGDTFGMAYNFTRGFTALVPIEGSRMQLLDVYERVYQQHEIAKHKFWYIQSKAVEKKVRWERNFRQQIWLHPMHKQRKDEPVKNHENPPTKEQHIQSLSPAELYNRFAITCTLFIGKIFTKIGMDTLEEVAEETLIYFEGVLKSNIKISLARISQIAGMVIYIVDSINIRKQKSDECSQAEHVRTIAVQFLLEMFSIVAERLLNLTLLSDWDNSQMEILSTALMLWCNWMKRNCSDWTSPHCRPKFSTRRLETSRKINKANLEDDVWVVFAKLMTRLDVILYRVKEQIFPEVVEIKTIKCCTRLKPLSEVYTLSKFGNCLKSSIYGLQFYYGGRSSEQTRAQIFLRLKSIRKFGAEYVTKRFGILSRSIGLYNAYQYTSEVKLLPPKKLTDSCGLDENHFWFWAGVLSKKQKEHKILRPDCNNARIILKKTKKVEVPNGPPPCPKLKVHEVWYLLGEKGYHADIVVDPIRVILDTNCFIQKFDYVVKLPQIFPYPAILPVSVVLELKGLSKGGLRTRYKERFSSQLDSAEAKEKLEQGNMTAEQCKIALEFINSNMKYFKVVTTTGRVLKLNTIYDRIQDDFYNPKESNDDRILETCRFIEGQDKDLRARDTPRRIFRNTVLLTGDRCLRIRTFVLDIPARDISSFLFWATNYYRAFLPPLPPYRTQRPKKSNTK